MHKIQQNHKQSTYKRKTPSLRSAQLIKKSKNKCKNNDGHKKIPQIINQLEQNIKLLKKCYNQQHSPQQLNLKNGLRRPNRPLSSYTKSKSNANQINFQEQAASLAEIDDLKKSFLSMHGYETNNIVELYNFYKKNLEKSTRLYGSTSMSNMINLTQNHSQIRDKGARPSSALVLSTEQIKQKQTSKNDNQMLPTLINPKKSNDMVNVATLLADKKKISRKNICENMNCDNLVMQAKKRLYRPNPNDNIQKLNKLKQNYRNQNIRISPSRKIKNYESKQKSSQKSKSKAVSIIVQSKNKASAIEESIKQPQKSLNKLQVTHQDKITTNQSHNLEQKFTNISLTKPIHAERQKQKQRQRQKQKEIAQTKQLKSAKSSRSIKSIKSPNSIKSPSLNQAILLDLTGSNQASDRKKIHPSYFVPKVHTNLHDSLLDCQITPKQQSKILDLESIPFDF